VTALVSRHIDGSQIADDDVPTFFPRGRTINGRELSETIDEGHV